MRKSTFTRAAALLIAAGAMTAVAVPAASAAPAPKGKISTKAVKTASTARTMPKVAAQAKTAKAAPQGVIVTPTYALLNPGDSLKPGDSVKVGYSTLTMQTDGNLVQYLTADNGKQIQVLWSSKTWGNNGASAVMQADGNFVIYKQDGVSAVWSTGTWNKTNAVFVLDGGELLVGNSNGGTPYWRNDAGFFPDYVNGQYVDSPADNLKGTGQYGQAIFANNWLESSTTILIQQADGNLVLYRKKDGGVIWAANTQGHPGALTVQDPSGVFGVADDKAAYWTNGTWDNPGAWTRIQSDGNMVTYRAGSTPTNGSALWSTNTWGKA
ncbi:hypothetical protein ACFYS8_22605 [Kitasatospora sp. NPDC004615]|uniref:hypothetical protein n=1 Tax=unclassified Kitasatospora TaxID=2633591 RepID=UPI0036A109AF